MRPDSPRERLLPDCSPLGSLIQGADLRFSFMIKSGLASGGSIVEMKIHKVTRLAGHIVHHRLELVLQYAEMTGFSAS